MRREARPAITRLPWEPAVSTYGPREPISENQRNMQFNLLDIIIISLLVLLFVRGLMAGFFKSGFSMLAVIGGFYVATYYYDEVLDLVAHLAPDMKFSNMLSFAAVFLAVYLVIRILGSSLGKLIDSGFFGNWDRILGGVLGLAKGVLVASFLTVALTNLLPPESSLLRNSTLRSYSIPICYGIIKLVPEKFRREFLAKVDEKPQPPPTTK